MQRGAAIGMVRPNLFANSRSTTIRPLVCPPMTHMSRNLLVVPVLLVCVAIPFSSSLAIDSGPASGHIWHQVVNEAEGLGLPTKFLKAVPPDFVTFEFDDLQAFAAEYHLAEHRMVLNRPLSFNAAGGTLRPLAQLTPVQIETLFHELFHAYMDYLSTTQSEAHPPLLTFARTQQRCRYGAVLITPVVQRKAETEERFLSEIESWEALNEAWAVFVGWAVWNQLELGLRGGKTIRKPGKQREVWLRRLGEADREGKLRGYYEPEDPTERAVTRKRFLAPASRLSADEAQHLMEEALGYSGDLIREATAVLARSQASLSPPHDCK